MSHPGYDTRSESLRHGTIWTNSLFVHDRAVLGVLRDRGGRPAHDLTRAGHRS